MSGLIGKKLGMIQIFDAEGRAVPVTAIKLGPCKVLQRKTRKKEGYAAIQLDFEEKVKREFRIQDEDLVQVGQVLTVAAFQVNENVSVVGTSKGRGFQGVIKRHGKAGGPASHGSRFHRTTGSIGQRTWPGEVFKNMKLPGHLGVDRVTVRNLRVVGVRPADDVLLVRGAVPGCRNGIVLVKSLAADFCKRFEKLESGEPESGKPNDVSEASKGDEAK